MFKFNKPPQNKNEGNIGKKAKRVVLATVMTGLSMLAHGKSEGTISPSDSTIEKTSDAKKIEIEVKKDNEKIEIKIANYFETDKAEISKENSNEIAKLVSTYIASLNKDNVDQFLSSNPKLNVSCDPRNTNSYENGNRGLAQARAETAQKEIAASASGADYSKSNLSPEQIKKVKEKFSNLIFNIPENGVIDYHAVATEAEWEEGKTNEAKKLEIYKKMRFVDLELAALNTTKPETSKIEKGGGLFETGNYEKVFLIIDQSPSMKESRTVEKIISHLEKSNQKGIPTQVVGYTNKINNKFNANSLLEGAEIIRKMDYVNENREETIGSLIDLLKGQEKSKGGDVAYVLTDEKLQNISGGDIESLVKLSKEKNIKILFTMMLEGSEFQLSLEKTNEIFDKKFNTAELVKRRGYTQERIDQLNKKLSGMEKDLADDPITDKYRNELNVGIEETKNLISIAENNLKNYAQIDIGYEDLINLKKNIEKSGSDFTTRANTVGLPGADLGSK